MFVTAYGRPYLYHNNGDGTFTDVTEKAGLGAKCSTGTGRPARSGSISITTAGWICLCAASSTTAENEHFSCGDNKLGRHFYCIPRVFKGTASLLFHNNGDGTFTEVGAGHRHREGAWARLSAWWRRTSTTTAGWICSSPTIRCRIFCS